MSKIILQFIGLFFYVAIKIHIDVNLESLENKFSVNMKPSYKISLTMMAIERS